MSSAAEPKPANVILIEQLKANMGRVSAIVEEQGKALFGEQQHILGPDDIHEYSIEFLELLVVLLQAGEHLGSRGPEFEALQRFFSGFARQILSRGEAWSSSCAMCRRCSGS